MLPEILFLHEQALKCLRLARAAGDEQTRQGLEELAVEFSERAAALERGETPQPLNPPVRRRARG